MIVAIIQARMSSTRLPGKVLQLINDRPMLWHVVQRTRQAAFIDRVVVATSTLSADDAIAQYCEQENIVCFRGNETDVLDRYYQAAKHQNADIIARVTADCPLLDPAVLDKVIRQFGQDDDVDYAANCLRYTYPNGLDVEVFSFAVLQQAWQKATSSAHREHVTDYMRTCGKFRLVNVENDTDLSHEQHRWTVDHARDLEFVREVYQELDHNGEVFFMDDVLALLRRRPELRRINAEHIRHEGYFLSLLQEEIVPPCELPQPLDFHLGNGRRILGNRPVCSVPIAPAKGLEEQLVAIIPCAEVVRFCEDETTAREVSLRLARLHAGREMIIHDIPLTELDRCFAQFPHQVAAVVVSTFSENYTHDSLHEIRTLTQRHGAYLIFDETHSGGRLAVAGAQEYFGVVPDLAWFGSSLANGKALGIVAAAAQLLEREPSFELPAATCQTAQATLQVLRSEPVIGHIWEQGQKLKDCYNVMARELGVAEHTRCVGLVPLLRLVFLAEEEDVSQTTRMIVLDELHKHQVLMTDRIHVGYGHTDGDIDHLMRAFHAALLCLANSMKRTPKLRAS